MRCRAALSLILGALLLPGVAVAQDESVAPSPEPRDLYADMPKELAGYVPDIVMRYGEQHFAGLVKDAAAQARLEGLLDEVGAGVADITSGYALASEGDFFIYVVAIRIEGVQPGSLLPAYLAILSEDLVDPISNTENVGGKEVLVISSVGEDGERADLYTYDEGDTIWMVQGSGDGVEVTIAGLPEPIGS